MRDILKNKIIYITGATAGIGFASAELLLKKGATVVITGRNNKTLESAHKKLNKISSNVIAHNIDVSKESEIVESLQNVYSSCGRIDGLINNAPSIHVGKIVDLDLAAWKTNFKANLDAVFLATKTVLPWMISAKKGSIAPVVVATVVLVVVVEAIIMPETSTE